ncbi:MAG: CAP domain-containing protein [Verrucomicrobiota bacterium]
MKIFERVTGNPGQMRRIVSLDPILCKVARQRAVDMERRNYFNHVNPSGQGPNFLVRRAGYFLPSYYDGSKSGNNIESIAMTTGTAREAFALWINSSPHKTHLLGVDSFYREQTSIGIGVYQSKSFPHYKYYVFISAPANAAKRPPLVILQDSKGKIVARTRPSVAAMPNPLLTKSIDWAES